MLRPIFTHLNVIQTCPTTIIKIEKEAEAPSVQVKQSDEIT